MELEKQIDIAANLIREGKVVAFPTDTVYGLGANGLDPAAVARIYEIKERPSFNPLILHIADIECLNELILTNDARVYALAEKFWPGPLTILFPKSKLVPDIVTAGLPTVGIRMPNHKIALELIRRAGCPIAAPSANKFGKLSPTSAQHVRKQLPNLDFVLDGGNTTVGIESTIISLNEEGFAIIRPGSITTEEIRQIVPMAAKPGLQEKIIAPGMLKSHYSPSKPFYILGESMPENLPASRAGLIALASREGSGYKKVIQPTTNGDLKEYAIRMFAAIHELEDSDVEFIVAEPVPETGIGIAIMDRMRKAAYPNISESR
ncbi:MAG TPA: L-threonylcarbamoyladenylate synthase [Bacteroidales bacterium]|nr:L-threonylcarbamoyladenylate synthase [Bacteroidales bacterium]